MAEAIIASVVAMVVLGCEQGWLLRQRSFKAFHDFCIDLCADMQMSRARV